MGDDNKNKKIPRHPVLIPYASGGYSAYSREKFLFLGGFHPIYSPFYCEDMDIGYKAVKKGWKNILEPASLVYHQGEQTSKKIDKKFVEYIKFRNKIIFYLTCLDNKAKIFLLIFWRSLNAFWSFKWYKYLSFLWLAKNWGKILEKKKNEN
jgi:GT2 family glycosyltransferase